MPLNPEEKWSNEKYYTITSIVDRCLADNYLTDHYFDDFLGWGLWELRELHLDVAKEVKTVSLDMNDTRGVELPNDYVDWVIVGIQIGQYVKTLGVNSDMAKFTGDQRTLGNPDGFNRLNVNQLPNGINVLSYGGYNLLGANVFSIGGGLPYKGYFNIIKTSEGKTLQFTSAIDKTSIYLEYISDGFNPNRETIVDPYFVDFLRKSMNSEWAQRRPIKERSEREIDRLGAQAFYAGKKLRGRKSDLDPQTMLNTQRKHYKLTPDN